MKVFPINVEIASTRTYSAATSGGVDSSSNAFIRRSFPPASFQGSVTIGLNTSIVLLPSEPMRKRLWDERFGYFTTRITYFDDNQHRQP